MTQTDIAKFVPRTQIRVERGISGKFVISEGGAEVPDGPYGFIAQSDDFPRHFTSRSGERLTLDKLTKAMRGDTQLSAKDIDQSLRSVGTLQFQTTAEGLFVARLRTRSQSGEEGSDRVFEVAQFFFLKGVCDWRSVPAGFFRFCWNELRANPPVQGRKFVDPLLFSVDEDVEAYMLHGINHVADNIPEIGTLGEVPLTKELLSVLSFLQHNKAEAFFPLETQYFAAASKSEVPTIWALDLATSLARLDEPEWGQRRFQINFGLPPASMGQALHFVQSRKDWVLHGNGASVDLGGLSGSPTAKDAQPEVEFIKSGGRRVGVEPIII
ncbi:hypothetical protein [Gymnodinialimonas sp.]